MSKGTTLEGTVETGKSTAVALRGRKANLLTIAPPRELPERANMIRQYHEAAVATFAQGAMYALLCGFELHAARAQLRHGEWGEWVERHCPFTARTAWNYMQAAERKFKEIPNLKRVSDFSLGVSSHDLHPDQRAQLVDAVRDATDGVSIRQLYLDLGLMSGAPTARTNPGDSFADDDTARRAKKRMARALASEKWPLVVGALREFVLVRNYASYLAPDEIESGLAAIRDCLRKLEGMRRD